PSRHGRGPARRLLVPAGCECSGSSTRNHCRRGEVRRRHLAKLRAVPPVDLAVLLMLVIRLLAMVAAVVAGVWMAEAWRPRIVRQASDAFLQTQSNRRFRPELYSVVSIMIRRCA